MIIPHLTENISLKMKPALPTTKMKEQHININHGISKYCVLKTLENRPPERDEELKLASDQAIPPQNLLLPAQLQPTCKVKHPALIVQKNWKEKNGTQTRIERNIHQHPRLKL